MVFSQFLKGLSVQVLKLQSSFSQVLSLHHAQWWGRDFRWQPHAHEPLQLATPVSRIKRGIWSSLPYSQQLFAEWKNTSTVFSAFSFWSCLTIPIAQWFVSLQLLLFWILISGEQNTECRGVPERNQHFIKDQGKGSDRKFVTVHHVNFALRRAGDHKYLVMLLAVVLQNGIRSSFLLTSSCLTVFLFCLMENKL